MSEALRNRFAFFPSFASFNLLVICTNFLHNLRPSIIIR